MAICVHVFFFNFIVKESKYQTFVTIVSWLLLLLITFPFPKHCHDTCMLRLPSLWLTFCLRDQSVTKFPFCCSLPSLGSKENRQKGWGIAESLKFPKKNFFLAFSPHKRKLAAVSNFSVTSCLLKALETE